MANRIEIDPAVREQLIEPFIAAVCTVLRDMTGVDAAPTDCCRLSTCQPGYDISAILLLQSQMHRAFMLGFPESTARDLAQRMLPESSPQSDEALTRDCMGEIANVTAGQAKALLHGSPYHFTFSTPQVVRGGKLIEFTSQPYECMVVDFQSEAGPFTLQICGSGIGAK